MTDRDVTQEWKRLSDSTDALLRSMKTSHLTPEERATKTLFGESGLPPRSDEVREFTYVHPASGERISYNDLVERYRREVAPKKLYLAATFSSQFKMALIADQLREKGFEITSEWVYGGEDGLTREQIATLDLGHVDAADTVVSFTYPRGTLTSGGGRHVEFGYALAKGKRCVVIGSRENVFHHAPGVEVYATLEEWLAAEGKGT